MSLHSPRTPDPGGSSHEVLVGIAENLRSSIRIDPVNNTQTIEANWQDFFMQAWGSLITAFNYGAYNTMATIVAPDNGDICLVAGAWITYPASCGTVMRNNLWYLVRRPNGLWHYGQILDSLNLIPPGNGLAATRTITKSPFNDEPSTYYFSGKDAGGPNPIFHNTAWIYTGKMNHPITSSENTGPHIPISHTLYQNYPNPFNPSTSIRYEICTESKVNLTIFDALGREIRTLVNAFQLPGRYSLPFTPHPSLSSGVYFYQLRAGDFLQTRKMIISK